MSQKSTLFLWSNTQIKLSRIITSEISAPKGFDHKRQAYNHVRHLFVKYNDLLKRLDEVYVTILHPQKRLILKILLDGLVGRLIELKQEMMKFDGCEYTYFEDIALNHNKTLDDLCIEIPRYFAQDRFQAIEQRNQMIKLILDRLEQSKKDYLPRNSLLIALKSDQIDTITLAHAVRVIQAHERARQGRVHAHFMRQMKKDVKTVETKAFNDNNLSDSCLIIQTIWRQKNAEKRFHQRKLEHVKLLDMVLPGRNPSSDNRTTDWDQTRRNIQIEYQQELDEAPDHIKLKLSQYEETEMKLRLEHILIQWLLESRQLYGQFPIYPSGDINGSATLFKNLTMTEVQEFVTKKTQLNTLEPSKFVPMINNQLGVYKDLFYERDESYNSEQRYDRLLLMDEFRPAVEEELRHDVDNILRNELVYLKLAIDNTEDKPMKKSKKKKKKKKRQRKKKGKDLVSNRTLDSIFEELVETKIILPTELVRQHDFIGDYQYSAETIRFNQKEPMPSLLDCQQLVNLQIVFPLCNNMNVIFSAQLIHSTQIGSQEVHLNLAPYKAILLAGPHGSGKELLVHIACNELGGLLLDLSPANLMKSFNTSDGLKILFAMIKRLVLTMSPILCMIRDTELLFSKKLTQQEKQYEPKRFKRLIQRFIKRIKPGERIMFIGLSSQPYRARIKPLFQIYQNIVLFPKPNYGSRRRICYEILVERNHMNITDVELSILASISKGYTAGQLLEAIYKVLKMKQKTKYVNNDCTAKDFIPILGLNTPVFIDEENKIKNWYAKTPNGVKRLKEMAQTPTKTKKSSLKK
ncbi:unnamed protein product [Adineta ricciae]|uniref:ATPase AAA-type core domain-containing protein n=1 Tax=Adineta ricciae TaxID=249248 RepID=A0A814G5Q5_ADIRI|nr:unnamed protein product [Adineta ricciae]